MSISLGNTTFGALYIGSVKIGEVYRGNAKVYPSAQPDPYNPLNLPPYTMRFKFDSLLYDPTSVSGSTPGTWTQVSSDPNIWDFTYQNAVWGNTTGTSTDHSVFSNQKLYWSYGLDSTGLVHTGGVPWIHVIGANTTGITNMNWLLGQQSNSARAFADICLFDTSSVTDMFQFMYGCKSITSIPAYDTHNVTNMRYAFSGTNAVTSAVAFNLSSCTIAYGAFYGCGTPSISLSNTSNVTDFESTFNSCSNITSITLDASSATMLRTTFSQCSSLTSVTLSNTGNVSNTSNMFNNCTSLSTVNLFDTSHVTNASSMFTNCTSLQTIPLFNTASATNLYGFVKGCTALTSIPLFSTASATNVYSMFEGCTAVESGALALYNQMAGQTTPPSLHTRCFYNCGSNTTSGAAELAQIPSDWK